MTIESLGGRRFILAAASLAVCSLLLWFGKLSDGGFTAIVMATVGSYIAADTFQRNAETRADVEKMIAQQPAP